MNAAAWFVLAVVWAMFGAWCAVTRRHQRRVSGRLVGAARSRRQRRAWRVSPSGRGSARRERERFADELDEVAMSISGGKTLKQALAEVAARPTSTSAVALVAAPDLIDAPGVDRDVRSTQMVVDMLLDSGADPVVPLERLVTSMRRQLEIDGEAHAAAAPAMASAVALSALPPLGVALLGMIEPATLAWLTTSPSGIALIVGAVGLNVAGWIWMRRIVGVAQ